MENRKYALLRQVFGYAAFRGGQEELIDALLSGRDAFGVMPTGGGKSLCYQLPALLLEGVALVISPLISLMKDQVMALNNAGVSAAFINSSLSPEQIRREYRELRKGKYKLVYVAPERLTADGFTALAQSLPISLVAVDEAHCISQWGQDFRPSYLKIAEFLDKLPRRPVVSAFTATATRQVQEDILRSLRLRDPLRLVAGFDRPNLTFRVMAPRDKLSALNKLTARRRGRSGIVYCATRREVERVCQALLDAGVPATRYHAGLPDEERRENQEDFIHDRRPVMVATNAFGMGIDKSNVAFVIHYNMPKSIEAYYQEAGRAGRDGERADCILLFSPGDIRTARFLIENSAENEELSEEERAQVIGRDLERLDKMVGYCKTVDCLRGYILDYFGQAHAPECAGCGNCLAGMVVRDVTREAQMILSCVRRVRDKLGYWVGASLITQVLRGSAGKRVLELKLDTLSTYGLMKSLPQERVRTLLEHLEREGYLYTDREYQTLRLSERAGDVLFRGERVELREREAAPERPEGRGKMDRALGRESPALPAAQPEEDLLTALKTLRGRLAREEGVPAYIIFTNAALTDMAAKKPGDLNQLLQVSGVGQVKARRYGEVFLAEIKKFR